MECIVVRPIALAALVAGCLSDPARPVAHDAGHDAPMNVDAPQGSAVVVFGDTNVEPGDDPHMCGVPEAASFKTTDSVQAVHSLRIYIDDVTGDDAKRIEGAIYDSDGSGNPTMLLASGFVESSSPLPRAQWQTLPLQTAFNPQPNHIYWIAAMCPLGKGTQFTPVYRYLGSAGAGPCDATQTVCTQHGRDSETTFDQTWSDYATFMASTNSYYADSQ